MSFPTLSSLHFNTWISAGPLNEGLKAWQRRRAGSRGARTDCSGDRALVESPSIHRQPGGASHADPDDSILQRLVRMHPCLAWQPVEATTVPRVSTAACSAPSHATISATAAPARSASSNTPTQALPTPPGLSQSIRKPAKAWGHGPGLARSGKRGRRKR